MSEQVNHILAGGLPKCRFSTEVPKDWPPGHSWSHDIWEINCPDCLAGRVVELRGVLTMKDVEMAALTALVNNEREQMVVANKIMEMNSVHPGYDNFQTELTTILETELLRRGITTRNMYRPCPVCGAAQNEKCSETKHLTARAT